MEINVNQYIENAKLTIAKLFCGFSKINEVKEVLSYFNEAVSISFDEKSDNESFAAHAGGKLKHEFNENGELLVQSTNISINLPSPKNSNSPSFNGWVVDIHHEIFHAFTKLMSSIQKCEKKENLYYAPSGGKISILQYANGNFFNNGDVPCTVLFNELVTDLIAYAATYKSITQIINGDDLKTIDDKYGHYNGYYELLQLGLVIFNGFANFPPDYDALAAKGIFNNKYSVKIDGQDCYYNDLLYGVMNNPMHIKIQFLKYCSEDDWEKLNGAASLILKDFQKRIINKDGVKTIMEIFKKYHENKMENMERRNNLNPKINNCLRKNFNERFEYAKNYYNVSLEQNLDNTGNFTI